MDPIKIEKLRAMKNYKRNHFLQSLFQYALTAFVLSIVFFKQLWYPSFYSSLKLFFLVSLPNIGAFIITPKCLFFVCNAIVIFLIGESKLVGSPSSSPASDIYDEYVRRNRSLQKLSSIEEKERGRKLEMSLVDGNVERNKEDVEETKEEKEEGGGEILVVEENEAKEEEQEKKEGVINLDGEEEVGLPADELNKRVEDFIAKVNKQRKLEARMLVSSG